MGSQSYTPRHGARHAAPSRPNPAAAAIRAAARRPVISGAVAVAMLGSVGATLAIGDPADAEGITAAALVAPQQSDAGGGQGGVAGSADTTDQDTARLAESRRSTNVSRSASREEARRQAEKQKKAKEAKAEKEARKKEAAREKREAAKPVSERDFTSAQIAGIQADPKPYAIELMRGYGWDDGQWGCLEQLWIGESDWDWNATNSSSGAYGIPQALPAEKMATHGSDWKTNPITQIDWGLNYIKLSYGSPCGALNFWNNQSPHWY
ncbi:hypothetical protein [Janibacter cremeus]|uniref:Lytic transglycosylase domain-containing protein n=1 Tax=Janibacter cremeus TaxID=1285192 RepID=A0A852VSK2_9MICO|nr:hypothetical protein [Janibacter cremeus]NYF98939.1 hypothetical protein [Janibacter cremeus]